MMSSLQVTATHNYIGEDEDELSFDKGMIILVVPYDDPEDEVSPLPLTHSPSLSLSPSLPLFLSLTHTHTHTH